MLVWLSFKVICAYLGVLDHAHWKCLDIFVASMHVRPHEQNLLHTSTNSGGIVDSSHLKLWVYPKPLTMSELTCDIYLNLPTYDNSTLHLHSFLRQCPAALTVQKMTFPLRISSVRVSSHLLKKPLMKTSFIMQCLLSRQSNPFHSILRNVLQK